MKHALIYTKKLEGAGLTREQAQAHLEILEEIVDGDMAAKTDVQNAKNEVLMELSAFKSEVRQAVQGLRNEIQVLRNEIQELRVEMDTRFREFRSEMDTRFQEVWAEIRSMRSDMKMMEQRIVLKMGVMIAAAVGFMSALFTLVR